MVSIMQRAARTPLFQSAGAIYELYLAKRLLEELALAEEAEDLLERSIHLQACRYYRDLLRYPLADDQEEPRQSGPKRQRR